MPPRTPRSRTYLLAVVAALTSLLLVAPSMASARTGHYKGVEYSHGHPTKFLKLSLTVTKGGRAFGKVRGEVEANCLLAGHFENFDFAFPGSARVKRNGHFARTFTKVRTVGSSEVHQSLELVGRLHGGRISGSTFYFRSYVENGGPGCDYRATWRGKHA